MREFQTGLDILRSRPREIFSLFERSEKILEIAKYNVGVGLNLSDEQVESSVIRLYEDLGLSVVLLRSIVIDVIKRIKQLGVELPLGKKHKSQRREIVSQILAEFDLVRDGEGNGKLTIRDINPDIVNILEIKDEEIENFIRDEGLLGQILNFVNRICREHTGVVVISNSSTHVKNTGPRISFTLGDKKNAMMNRNADKILESGNDQVVRLGLLKESLTFTAYMTQRERLSIAISNGEVLTMPKFTPSQWPHDALMTHLRREVSRLIQPVLTSSKYQGDPLDLKYQVLFYLTSIDPKDIFKNGEEVQAYLHEVGAYQNWRNILRVDPNYISSFVLNEQVLGDIVYEQALIISDRIKSSDFPIEGYLRRSGIFAEEGWVIQRRNGHIYAVQEESITANSSMVPLRFEEIDPSIANIIHRDLHYIHTPRADVAFGLFVDDEKLPFSVLALEKIDRAYKQNVLLFQGYDPRKCFDLTRLYSKPGVPGNTSSSMFALAFSYMKTHYPSTQAVLSSFMPSYATGVSMTSGGFDNPVLIKPLSHVFVARNCGGIEAYEHFTNRRLAQESLSKRRYSRLPLLPTVELMAALHPPRFTQLTGANSLMIELV